MLSLLLVSGCSAQPETSAPPVTGYNATDVMYLQMSLAQITEGEQVASLAEERAADARIRAVAAELRGQWRAESESMRRWLREWKQPLTADPSAGAHAGHGALHMLRPSDIAELRSADPTTFDGTAVSLLLGHLGNCVETSRMESAAGAHPPAKALADTQTRLRQGQVRRLLTLSATQ